jgi:hypothetical protein
MRSLICAASLYDAAVRSLIRDTGLCVPRRAEVMRLLKLKRGRTAREASNPLAFGATRPGACLERRFVLLRLFQSGASLGGVLGQCGVEYVRGASEVAVAPLEQLGFVQSELLRIPERNRILILTWRDRAAIARHRMDIDLGAWLVVCLVGRYR